MSLLFSFHLYTFLFSLCSCVASGVTYAVADATLRETSGALNAVASVVRAVASGGGSGGSGGSGVGESKEESGAGTCGGPEFEVVDSSSSEEEDEDVSDLEEFQDCSEQLYPPID